MIRVHGNGKWNTRRIRDICRIMGGRPAPKEDQAFENGTIPFVRMKDLGAYHVTSNLISVQDKLNAKYLADRRLPIVPRGAILMPRSGSVALNHRAILGVDAVIVSHICALVVEDPSVDVVFLYHLLRQTDLSNITKKTTGLDAITFSDLSDLKVSLPPLPIQKQIAAILEKADAAREKRRQANRLTEQFLQSAFLEMFGDPMTNPKGWEAGKFSEMVRETKLGLVRGSSEQGDHLPYFYVKMNNIVGNGILDLDEIVKVDASDAEVTDFSLKRGDFLFNTRNSRELVGKTALFNGAGTYLFNNNILRVRFKATIRPEFLNRLFQTRWLQNELDKRKSGTTSVFAIYYKDLGTLPVLVPPITEQKKFAALVEKVESLRVKQRESEKELEDLFNSLMKRAFRGELVQ